MSGRPRRLSSAVFACLLMLALTLAGCGAASAPGDRIAGHHLTIYASLPLAADDTEGAQTLLNGAHLALAQAGGHMGTLEITLRPLNDSVAPRPIWDPGQTSVNARGAAADTAAVGYLGELDSGATAVSIPVLERAGIAQVSPGSPAPGLTAGGPGASPGEPEKYYPTGVRTFVRLLPDDAVQARAVARLQRQAGCVTTYLLDDRGAEGQAAAQSFSAVAAGAGLRVAGEGSVAPVAPVAAQVAPVAAAVAATGSRCLLLSASSGPDMVTLLRALGRALPRIRLFATSSTLGPALRPRPGQVLAHPVRVARPPASPRPRYRALVVSPMLPEEALPPMAQAVAASYRAHYGTSPTPEAFVGYEAMSVMLDALRRASDNGRKTVRRSKVRAALLSLRDHVGVLGTYSITPSGATTLSTLAVFGLARGHLRFWRTVT